MMIRSWRIVTELISVFLVLLLSSGVGMASDVYHANVEGINRTLMDMLRQIKTLQNEVQQLRGEVELHGHTLNAIKNQQRQIPQESGLREDGMAKSPASTVVTPPEAPIVPALAAPSVQPPAIHVEEQGAYDNAFSLLRSGSYDESIKSFREFLAVYPKSQFAANSQYWIGEAYYVTRRFKEAIPEFQQVVENYPDANKASDALLKVGYIQYELDQTVDAIKSLENVIAQFPESTAAKLASTRLAKMKR